MALDVVKCRRFFYAAGALDLIATFVWTAFHSAVNAVTIVGIVLGFVLFRVGATLGDKRR